MSVPIWTILGAIGGPATLGAALVGLTLNRVEKLHKERGELTEQIQRSTDALFGTVPPPPYPPTVGLIATVQASRRDLSSLVTQVDHLSREVQELLTRTSELQTNGGHSVKDAINRIEKAVARLEQK